MDYCKDAKVGVSIKGQKMAILVYIYEASSQTLSLQNIFGILLSQAKIYLRLFCFPLSCGSENLRYQIRRVDNS
jgi:hypothetical protein